LEILLKQLWATPTKVTSNNKMMHPVMEKYYGKCRQAMYKSIGNVISGLIRTVSQVAK